MRSDGTSHVGSKWGWSVISCRIMRCGIVPILGLALLWGHDDLDGQIARVSELIAADPGNASLLLRRSELHRLHADLEKALADVRQAQAVDAGASGIDRQLGRILMEVKDFQGAEAAFTRHLERNPVDGDALASRAECRFRLGLLETAGIDLESAIARLHQPDPDLLCRLADVLHAQGRTDEAIARLDAASNAVGMLPAYAEKAFAIERDAQRWDAALARLDRLAAGPAPAQWLLARGDLLQQLGRTDEAQAAYRAAADHINGMPMSRRTTAAQQNLNARVDAALNRPKE